MIHTTTKTQYYGQDKDTDQAVERLVRNEIYSCQTALIDELFKREIPGFQLEEIENLFPDPSNWDEDQCREWLTDEGPGWDEDRERETNEDIDDYLDRLREDIQEQADPQEIFEWWLISGWLSEKLRDMGEPILDNDYGEWWGRTCTGQSIVLDPTFYEIYANMNK